MPPRYQGFFTDRLLQQRHASPHTVAAYRDAWELLVRFAATHLARAPSQLELGDLDAALIARFLVHLEQDRANSVRTRNARLAAIHALFRDAAPNHPGQAGVIARVLAIPLKRGPRRLVTFLSDVEVDALLAAPDRTTWTGRRDHTLLAVAVQTGLRASELIGLHCADLYSAPARRPGRPPRPCGRSLAKGAACRRPARRAASSSFSRCSLRGFQ